MMIISWAILAGMLASSVLCAGKTLSADANRLIFWPEPRFGSALRHSG